MPTARTITGVTSGLRTRALIRALPGSLARCSARAALVPSTTEKIEVSTATFRLVIVALVQTSLLTMFSYQRNEKPVGGNWMLRLSVKEIGTVISMGRRRKAPTKAV